MPPENGTSRREELLAVATKLFAARGYHGTRMDDVADVVAAPHEQSAEPAAPDAWRALWAMEKEPVRLLELLLPERCAVCAVRPWCDYGRRLAL